MEKIKPALEDFEHANHRRYRHMSDAEKYRIAQVTCLIREAGFIEAFDGTFRAPASVPIVSKPSA